MVARKPGGHFRALSGRRDLNPGSPAPQAGALTKLGHVPFGRIHEAKQLACI
jgi:hypothetical protein